MRSYELFIDGSNASTHYKLDLFNCGYFYVVSDSLFSTGYTFGAPTPPPGSPYSPVPVAQLEFLTKGFNASNIIAIQQPSEYQSQLQPQSQASPKKIQKFDDDFEDKCCGGCFKQLKLCICRANNKLNYNNNNNISSNNNNPVGIPGGCSRTNPVDWSTVSVKKEPGAAMVPCQVAEISTSVSPMVKVEIMSPTTLKHHNDTCITTPVVTTNGNCINEYI